MSINNKQNHLPYLDGWRGAAILAVIVGHFFPVPGINLGPFGVELFFVLSGRLMADILFIRKPPLSVFFRRRFSRVYPALLAFATAMYFASVVGALMGIQYNALVEWPEYVSALTFVTNYTFLLGHSSVLNHVWSLCVEEHSYVLLACLAVLTARSRGRAGVIAVGAGLLCMLSGITQSLYGLHGEHELYWRTDVRVASVFLSAGVYLLRPRMTAGGPSLEPLVAPLCVCVAAALHLSVFHVSLKYSVSTVLLALAINWVDQTFTWLKDVLSSRLLTGLGFCSFSLYLWQQPLYLLKEKLGSVVALMIAGGLALMSYYLIEKPARVYLNRVLGRSDIARGASEYQRERGLAI